MAAGIRFVVVSGNQYYQLISVLSGNCAQEIAFVAENGRLNWSAKEDIYNGELTKEADFQAVVEHLLTRRCGDYRL